MKSILLSLLQALLLTILIETLLAFLIFKIKNKKDIINIILINALTNPLLNITSLYILLKLGYLAYDVSIIIMEIIVFVGEGLFYKKVLQTKTINPIILSLALNGASYLTGILINNII